ncbi:MAG TPA: hypothetical protein DFR83_10135 [Deltaproteobacteria bacterium]|nr:hypothetical protein [Deltaproteobacteria bacterium]
MSVNHRPARSGHIRQAQTWDDPAVLSTALQIQPDDDVLSVCAAGDNAFALAIDGARSVTCVHPHRAQLALAELKLLAARVMPVQGLQSILGFDIGGNRVSLYRRRVRDHLSAEARTWWDAHEDMIRAGIVQQGRQAQNLARFRRRVLPLVHRTKTIRDLLALDRPEEQRTFFEAHWNTRRWRALVRLGLSDAMLAWRSSPTVRRDSEADSASQVFRQRAEHVLCTIPARTNYLLHGILTGSFPDLEAAHPYLSTTGRAALAERAERVRFVVSELEAFLKDCAPQSFSAFHYASIFEQLDAESHSRILTLTARAARPGARICYWNRLVPRWRPDALAVQIERDEALGATLLARDRSWFCSAVQVETVR